jgi:hypothetical protein
MKNNFFLLAWICILPVVSIAQLINNGATIVVSAGTNLVLDNLSLQNNGVFTQTTSTVTFTGSTNAFIGGTNELAFYMLHLNKPAATLELQRSIVVNNQLQFTNGLLHLNTNNILLDPAALLIGENETSHIYGTVGYVQIIKTLNAPSADNPGNLGAVITSSQNPGSVTIRRGHQSQVNNTGGGSSVLRYYDIMPANNTGLNATLRFIYLDAELNGLNENNLMTWKSTNNVDWINLGRTNNNTVANYVEKTGINDFARLTLSPIDNPLPLVWGSFNTQCLSGQVRISWKTEQEENTSLFIIRRSTDRSTWTTIATLPAAGNSSSPSSYSYTDPQPLAGTSYYQVQEQDIDGRLVTSPVLLNNCGAEDIVKVFPNPVQNSCWVSMQSARSGSVTLRLYDSKGALVQQRRQTIQTGNSQFELHMNTIAKGIYSLVITLPDGSIKAVKIEKI